MKNGIPRILIVRLSAIGDVVRVLPALHSIRDAHPHAQIDWAVEAKSRGVVEGHPCLDDILVFERPAERKAAARAFWQFVNMVRARRYEVVLDFHGIFKSGLLVWRSGARDRYGFARPRGREGSSIFLNRRLRLPDQVMNRVEENLALCREFGVTGRRLDVQVAVPPDIEREVGEYFERSFDGGKRLVAVHAPVDRPEKQWPLAHYAELVELLMSDGRFEVLLTWGPGQLEMARQIAGMTRRNPEVAPETPTLKHLAALLGHTDLFFGGDTGPMHIAAALGTPVVAVFGGTNPAQHQPVRGPAEVLYQGPEKRGRRVSLEEARRYLEAVTPDMAYEACLRIAAIPRSTWNMDTG